MAIFDGGAFEKAKSAELPLFGGPEEEEDAEGDVVGPFRPPAR